ncbi:MAG: glycosyl transferase [Pirellulaceae bacterium]|nr:MAG: glycosyl transferase [Pirellulaceae bacterium]
MPDLSLVRKVAFVGDYLPRQCGIATYTYDLCHAVAAAYPGTECIVVPVDDIPGGYDYGPEVRFQFSEQELEGYLRAADFLNFARVDVVCLQHEFGIFGGRAGDYILAMVNDLRAPVVTTLHTVLEQPNSDQFRVLTRLAEASTRLIVMSQRGKTFLETIYRVPSDKIDVIPHGIPDMPFVDPNFYKDKFDVEGKYVLLTFGLLSPNKGIEYVLEALPQIVAEFPNTVYIVLGATHPNLVRQQGERYRMSLERLAEDLGIRRHVMFYNRFVELRELLEFIGAADIYITPYLNPAQITSGTLAYAFGCGKAVVSTPYWHAEELLAEDRGILVPFRDSQAIARAVCELLRDEPRRHAMRKRAYMLGRDMVWNSVAHLFMDSFRKARLAPVLASRPPVLRTLEQRRGDLPRLKLDHLLQLTDSVGLWQHAQHTIPDYRHGYCADDNARALILTIWLEELGLDTPDVRRAATTYAAFLGYAFDSSNGRFRNFLGFDRRWQEADGSDDALGRAVWALGACTGRSRRQELQAWAVPKFERALAALLETTSPRAWAFGLLGIHEYLRRLSGDRWVAHVREILTERLLERFRATADDQWPWFEDVVTYNNATLPHALLLSGRWMGHADAWNVALRSLEWLCRVQRSPSGCFRPIGNQGFYTRGGEPAPFDQQPIEAQAMTSACIEAYYATGDARWLDRARWSFEWFLGRNDLGVFLYDSRTGGCRDGLQADGANENQGAESTLAFLMALAEMRLLQSNLATARPQQDASQRAEEPAASSASA